MDATKSYDLEERTAKLGESVIVLCKSFKLSIVSRSIVDQLVRSATSVGANYMEANGASSRRDFRNKIFLCKKEVQESKHWLRMLIKCYPECSEKINELWRECQELTLIFNKIGQSLN